jgi:hypothetical protein
LPSLAQPELGPVTRHCARASDGPLALQLWHGPDGAADQLLSDSADGAFLPSLAQPGLGNRTLRLIARPGQSRLGVHGHAATHTAHGDWVRARGPRHCGCGTGARPDGTVARDQLLSDPADGASWHSAGRRAVAREPEPGPTAPPWVGPMAASDSESYRRARVTVTVRSPGTEPPLDWHRDCREAGRR